MSLEKIHLRKLLQIFYAPDNKRISLLRADIRNEISKENDASDEGGDFHSPFWSDAKLHAAGKSNLTERTTIRIASNKGRARLYPRLKDSFLRWWNEKRRWRNETFTPFPESVSGQLIIPKCGIVKIENVLAIRVGDQFNRIIYPYFSEVPELPEEGARLGLWAMGEAFGVYSKDDLRILDVLRSTSFGTVDQRLRGNEKDLFERRYTAVVREWKKLWKEYK